MPAVANAVPDVIKPSKKVGDLKVWHILLAAGILVLLGIVISNFVIVQNVVTSSTGEQYIRKSLFKPLSKTDAQKLADKAVTKKKPAEAGK